MTLRTALRLVGGFVAGVGLGWLGGLMRTQQRNALGNPGRAH